MTRTWYKKYKVLCNIIRCDKVAQGFTKDASLIITQLLNYGGEEAKDWVWKNYSESEIVKVVNHPQRGTWNRNILREILTKNILGIKKWTILFSVL